MDKKALDGLALLHDLVPFLPVDRLHAILRRETLPHTAEGAALFADISGFSTLAERLAAELGPERGAEELNTQVNYTFVGLIDAVDRYHGSVLRFSGDGITAWFGGEDHALRAVTSALAMQAIMQAVVATLPDLRLKISIGGGRAWRYLPGDPALGVFDVMAGPAFESMVQAEHVTGPGQIVLSSAISAAVGDLLSLEPIADGFMRLKPTIFAPPVGSATRWASIRWLDHADRAWELVEACRPYLPPPIYERLRAGHGTYMADLRTASPLFVRFTGIDYSTPEAADQLDDLVRQAQSIALRYGGYLSEVGVDDKGSVLVVLFGAPVALENPSASAARAAHAMLEELPHVHTLHCGLTRGDLFAGMVGSPMRRAYAVIGDEVNLAARLMSHAGSGDILADQRVFAAAGDFAWETLQPIRVKGKVAPVRVYRLLGLSEVTRPLWPEGYFIARARELHALQWVLEATRTEHPRILVMEGAPGLGKSHLLSKFATMLRERGVTGLFSTGRRTQRQRSYHAWRDIFAAYFSLDGDANPDSLTEQVRRRIAQIVPERAEQAALLNDLLPVNIPESPFTASLEPAQRQSVLTDLLIALLQAWLAEDALVLVMDNAQWLDELSWDLLAEITTRISDYPLSVLIAMRPPEEGQEPEALARIKAHGSAHELKLEPLSRENIRALTAEMLRVQDIPDALVNWLVQKTGGNPFFIREIVAELENKGIIQVENSRAFLTGDLTGLELPDTVQGMVRSRIDRLPPDQQVLLKVAAVIGEEVPFRTVQAVQPLNLDEAALRASLDALEAVDLHRVASSPDDNPVYAFRYAITREVAYRSLSFLQRRQLHRAIAQWYEHEYADRLAPYYAVLAHHWRAAENTEREYAYTYLAGIYAASHFANEDAIALLERSLELAPVANFEVLYDTLLQLENVYHLRGNREKQHSILTALSALAEEQDDDRWRAQVDTQWARYYESVAEYIASIDAAQRAFEVAERIGDRREMALSNLYWGVSLMRIGRYEEAVQRLSQPFASEGDEVEARTLDILGVTLTRMGRHEEAQAVLREALNKAEALNDRVTIGRALNNLGNNQAALGDYEEALASYEQALVVRDAIGDRQGVAAVLHNMGNVALEMGDYEGAQQRLEHTFRVFESVGDRRSQAVVLHNLGRLAAERGDYESAKWYLLEALYIRRDIGDREGISRVLIDLAHTEAALDNLLDAESYFGESLALAEQMGRPVLEVSHYAGWASLALRLGNQAVALANVEDALVLIENYGLAQVRLPCQVALACYEVLLACGRQEQARELLEKVYTLLMARANRITDPERRSRYLLAVPAHRRVLELAENRDDCAEEGSPAQHDSGTTVASSSAS